MLADDAALLHAAGTGGGDVVGAQGLDQVDPHQAQEDAAGEQAQGERPAATACCTTSHTYAGSPHRIASSSRMLVLGLTSCSASSVVIEARPDVGQPTGRRQLQQQADEEDRCGVEQDRQQAQHDVGQLVARLRAASRPSGMATAKATMSA